MSEETRLPVLNFDKLVDCSEESVHSKHGSMFPSSVRGLVIGRSGCGKSNLVLTLLLHPNGLRYSNIYVYSKSLHQPKYKFLEEIMKDIEDVNYHSFSESESVISPSEAEKDSIFVFDDIATEKQNHVKDFFFRGRHHNVCSLLAHQSYANIGKHLIRENANMIVAFQQDQKNVKHIFSDHVNSDMSLECFRKICDYCWNDRFGFIVIIKDFAIEKRYRKGFDEYINISNFV